MRPRPEIVLDHLPKRKPRVSVILIDWSVRESFHSLHYLNRQTAPRDDYELIWVEFHDRQPDALRQMAVDSGSPGRPGLDRWITLGYPAQTHYHKHRMYNVGILLSRGDICVICDSDAVFAPTFIEKIIHAFETTANAVVHLDEARNTNQDFYPFNYPSIEQILRDGAINWQGTTTLGLDNSPDMLHHANYGACMAAWRKDLLAVGGADEDLDYLGYVCGPYDLTFRLHNYGRNERWLQDEFLYHTYHPNQYGWNVDHHGPHDGLHMAMPALEARASFRVRPYLKNPWLGRGWWRGGVSARELVLLISEQPEPTWDRAALPAVPGDRVYWMQRDYFGFNVFHHGGVWYGLRTDRGVLDAKKLRAGAYREIWPAPSWQGVCNSLPIDYHQWSRVGSHVSLPVRLLRKALAESPTRLPARLLRKARRMMTS